MIILGEIITCNFSRNGHIWRNENFLIKELINALLNSHWIYKKKVGQFKQTIFIYLFMKCYFKLFFYIINLIFVNTLSNELHDYLFIYSIWINFAKEIVC